MPRTTRAAIVQVRQVLTSRGWLSHQPLSFQEAVLARGVVRSFRRNETVHAPGVEMPGIYAVISGIVCLGGIPLPWGGGHGLAGTARLWSARSGWSLPRSPTTSSWRAPRRPEPGCCWCRVSACTS